MTARDFREIALSFPEAVESAHMSHPDFRVGGRIFATLGYPDEEWGMIKLTPEEQRSFVRADPAVFRTVKGAWGRRGNTNVYLPKAMNDKIREALGVAWSNTATPTQ
jgi:YjbR protein